MKHISEIDYEGFIVDNYHHHWVRDMIKERDAVILNLAGDKAIITGVEADGANTTAGVITFNGKIYRFLGGITATNVVTKRIATDRPNDQQIIAPAYYEDVIEFGDTPNEGFETFPFSELTRVKDLQAILEDENLVNIAPDWNQSDNSKKDFIKNKPALLSQKVLGELVIGDIGSTTSVSVTGQITSASILDNNGSDYRFKVNFASVGTTNYFPDIIVDSKDANYNNDNDVFISIKNRTATSFEILARELVSVSQNINILIRIIV